MKRTKTVNALEQDHADIMRVKGTLGTMQSRAVTVDEALHLIVEWFRTAHPEMFKTEA